MTRHDVMFWICAFGTVLNLFLVYVTGSVPGLQSDTNTFLYSGAIFAVGMVANYINIWQASKTETNKKP